MFLRRLAFTAFWTVLALFVLRRPEEAAATVHAIGGALALTADALAVFTKAL